MPLELPHDDEFFAWRETEFPFFTRKTFLTHASISPLPARAARALSEYAHRLAEEGQFEYINQPVYNRCKQRFARLLNNGAKPEEIAFAGSTSHALGLVATSLDWKKGDNMIAFDGDFPANVVVWKNLEFTHGVEVRMVPFRPARDWTTEDLEPLVDERTRLVTISAINFLSGLAVDVTEIGKWCHERGILLCVDAIQALGGATMDYSEADFVCADAHKWMLGPNGTAFTWFRGEVMARMRPQIFGWLAPQERENWFSYDLTPHPTAERFEPGARAYVGIVATDKALELLEDYGFEAVSKRVSQLRDFAVQKLQNADFELRALPKSNAPGGIVTFRAASDEATKNLYEKLDERFALSIRDERDGSAWIRISPHFMNHERDIEELMEAPTA